MKRLSTIAILLSMTTIPAFAETRSADSHVHGTGMLMIAVEGGHVSIGFEAPGADIAGFEHAADSDEDKARIAAAEKQLSDPLALFVLPEAAACEVESVKAALADDEHDHGAHDDHDDHADHDDHNGHDHSHGSEHSEFHAEYQLHCSNPSALTEIRFDYFETFPNAQTLNVQIIDGNRASGLEVHRDKPVLKTGGIN